MNDIMVDLETMDNKASAAIVSIGAVQCNLVTGETGDTFSRVVDLEGQAEKGLTISSQTLYWWLKQSDGAREGITTQGKITLNQMCSRFIDWLHSLGNPELMRLWGNGASFDNAILRHASIRVLGEDLPIPFWNDRDMRTIVGFYPRQLQIEYRRTHLREGIHHSALADAKHQVKYCSHILQELGVSELY